MNLNNYYISSSSGNDKNDGRSPEKAWKSFSNLSLIDVAGTNVCLKCGDVWNDTLKIANAKAEPQNPFCIMSYGEGEKPRIQLSGKRGEKCIIIEDASNCYVRDLDIGNCGGLGILFSYNDSYDNENINIENCSFHHIYGIDQLHPQKGENYQFSAAIGIGGIINKRDRKNHCFVDGVHIRNCSSFMCGSLLVTVLKTIDDSVFSIDTSYLRKNVEIENCVCENNTIYGAVAAEIDGGFIRNCRFNYNGTRNLGVGTAGIMLGNIRNFTVSDCEIAYQQRLDADPDGCAVDFECNCDNVVLKDCYIHHNAGSGVMFFSNSGQINHNCKVSGCTFEYNNQNGFIPSGNEVYFDAPNNNIGGSVCNNFYYAMPGVSFTNTYDSSVTVKDNTEKYGQYNVSEKKVFRAGADHNFANGEYGWSYYAVDLNDEWRKLNFVPKRAIHNDAKYEFCLVGNHWQHPYIAKSVRRWTALKDGTVSVLSFGKIRCDSENSSGVWVSAQYNGKTIFGPMLIKDRVGVSFPQCIIDVSKNDVIDFVVDDRGIIGANTLIWDPVVCYNTDKKSLSVNECCSLRKLRYSSVKDFREVQGYNGWSYLVKNNEKKELAVWNTVRNRYETGDNAVISQLWQSSNNSETIRKWTAPFDGELNVFISDLQLESIGENISADITVSLNDVIFAQKSVQTGKNATFKTKRLAVKKGDELVFSANIHRNRDINIRGILCSVLAHFKHFLFQRIFNCVTKIFIDRLFTA